MSAEKVKAAAKVAIQNVCAQFNGKLKLSCNACGVTTNYLSTNLVTPELIRTSTQSDFEAALLKNTKCPHCKCTTSLVVHLSYVPSWTNFYNEARQALKVEVDHKTAVKEHATRSVFGLVCPKPSPVYTDMPSIPAARVIKTIHHADEWGRCCMTGVVRSTGADPQPGGGLP